MGFLNGSPLFFRNAARFARAECQVQSENFLEGDFFGGEVENEDITLAPPFPCAC